MKVMNRRNACWLAGLLILLAGQAVQAQKVGYLDSKKVFAQYRGSADIRQELNRLIEGWNRDIAARKKTIDSLERALEDQDLAISSERRKARREEIARKKSELEALVKDIFDPGGKADQKNRELSRPMAERIGNIVKRVALENNLLMVLDSSGGLVAYAAKDLDITDQVLEELAKEEGTAAKILPGIALFPVWELDAESIKRKQGRLAYDYLFSFLEKGQQFKPVPKKQVEDLVKDRGLSKSEVRENRGLEMARILGVRYMVLGSISQNVVNNQITIVLKLYDVEMEKVLAEETERISGEGEMAAGCEKLVERLSQKVQP